VLAGQHDRVTLQLLDAEQLRAQQLGIPVVTQRIPCACRKSELFDDDNLLLARTRAGQSSPGLMTGICRKRISRACGSSAFTCRFGHNYLYAVLMGIEVVKLK
jgi:hypothetical protein